MQLYWLVLCAALMATTMCVGEADAGSADATDTVYAIEKRREEKEYGGRGEQKGRTAFYVKRWR